MGHPIFRATVIIAVACTSLLISCNRGETQAVPESDISTSAVGDTTVSGTETNSLDGTEKSIIADNLVPESDTGDEDGVIESIDAFEPEDSGVDDLPDNLHKFVTGPGNEINPEEMLAFIRGLVRPFIPEHEQPIPSEKPDTPELVADLPKDPVIEDQDTPDEDDDSDPPPPEPPVVAEVPVVSGNLVLDIPRDGSYYTSLTDFLGEAPGFSELQWRSEALDTGGVVPVGEDGSFIFSISTHKYSNIVDVSVTGTDSFGDRQEVSLALFNDGVGPSVDISSPRLDSYYFDELQISGEVGAGPFDPEGIGEVESLSWTLNDEELRPIFFGADGGFSFKTRTDKINGLASLVFLAADLNGNETRITIPLMDGRLAPDIAIGSPADTDEYGAGFYLAGSVIDPYGGVGELGGIESLSYEIVSTEAITRDGIRTGKITPDPDGTFRIPVLTDELSGAQELSLIVIGLNGKRTVQTITLSQGRSALPDFEVQSSDASAIADWSEIPLASDYEVTVQGANNTSVRYQVSDIPFRVSGLENGREYTFTVEAGLNGKSVASHEVKTIPLAPDTLKPTVLGEFRRMRLRWDSVPGTSAYSVFRAASPEGPFEQIAGNVGDQEFLDTNAEYGKRYWYSISPAAYKSLLSAPEWGETLASQGQNVEQVGRLESLSPDSVEIEGDYAFVASRNSGLVIVDITEPARPESVGRVDINESEDVAVKGDYAYVVAGKSGLKVVNIVDPRNPMLVGSKLAGDASSIVVSGDYVFVSDREKGLRVLDVGDPRNPSRVSATENMEGRDLVIFGSHLFLAAGTDGIFIFDIASPSRPRQIGQIPIEGAEVVYIKDSLLLAGGLESGMSVFDLSSVESPRLLSTLPNLRVSRLDSSEEFILAMTPGGLVLIDLRVPSEPSVFQSYPMDGAAAMAVSGDSLLVANTDGLGLYQTYLVGSSFVMDEKLTAGRSYGISEHEGQLFVSSHSGGVSVLTPDLVEIIRLDTDFAEAAVPVDSDRIIVADGVSGLRVLSADGNENILFENNGRVRDVSASSNRAYAATDSGVLVLNIEETAPLQIGLIPFNSCTSLAVENNVLYAVGANELRSYAILEDGLPSELSRKRIPGVRKVSVGDDYVVIAGTAGVEIYSSSNPGNLELLGSLPMPDPQAVTVTGSLLYVSAGARGLEIYDIRRPESPKMISACDEVFAFDTVVIGDRAYIADGDNLKEVQIFIPNWLR